MQIIDLKMDDPGAVLVCEAVGGVVGYFDTYDRCAKIAEALCAGSVPGYREDPAYYALDYDPIDHEDDYWDDFAAGRLYAVVEDGR